MRRSRSTLPLLLLATLAAAPAFADVRGRALDVEVWTDRGNEAVYQPGDAIEVRARTSDDAYLLLYEIDAEGDVRLLYPDQGSRGFVTGRETYRVPSDRSNMELVVQGPVGQGFIVALASRDPFRSLPWYLQPYDPHAQGVGYEGEPQDEEGVTREGRIVGDPYVAMERIRRQVLQDPEDADAFGTAYTSYYVHQEVRYPRYLCYDCHRPNYWAWWDGFDPYYARCSVFDFRVNWSWGWGPPYWNGYVPYYLFVYRPDCPPRFRLFASRPIHYSSWDGWGRWRNLWGDHLRRFKTDPPVGYTPPGKPGGRGAERLPPGFITDRGGSDSRRGSLVSVPRDVRRNPDLGRFDRGSDPRRTPDLGRFDRGSDPRRTPDLGRFDRGSDPRRTPDLGRFDRGSDRGRFDGERKPADGSGDRGRLERDPGWRQVERPDDRPRDDSPRFVMPRGERPAPGRWSDPPRREESPRFRPREEPRQEAPRSGRHEEARSQAPRSEPSRPTESRSGGFWRGRNGKP